MENVGQMRMCFTASKILLRMRTAITAETLAEILPDKAGPILVLLDKEKRREVLTMMSDVSCALMVQQLDPTHRGKALQGSCPRPWCARAL